MNAYEQPDQPMFNRYDFLSSFEEQEPVEPNESNETGDDKQGETLDKYTLGPDCDSGCLDQGVRVCGHEYAIKHQYGPCPTCGRDHHEAWCPKNNED